MLIRETARNGEPILTHQGKALFSRFNPSREAERYISSQIKGGSPPETVLILGDILGYLGRSARKLFPQARVLGIDLSEELENPSESYDALFRGNDAHLADFLSAELDDQATQELLILQWEPALRIFSQIGAGHMRTVRRRLLIAGGNLSTLRGFGRRWIKNSLLNFLFQPNFVSAALTGRGAYLIASGPSLERCREMLAEGDAVKITLASSLAYMHRHRLKPDLLVQTDPGFYADYHLRLNRDEAVPVAMPLSARPLALSAPGTPLLIIDQQEPLERTLIQLLDLGDAPLPALPSTGTVAASALFLSRSLKAEPVLLCGLDLCYNDIRTHASPHSFDPVFAGGSSRLAPLYSRRFDYSRRTASEPGQSRALKIYADWFTGLGEQPQIFRLYPSAVALPFHPISASEFHRIAPYSSRISYTALSVPKPSERKAAVISLLKDVNRNRSQDRHQPLLQELGEKLAFDWESVEERRSRLEELTAWVSSLGVR